MAALKLRETISEDERRILLDIVREDFDATVSRIANMTNEQILAALQQDAYLQDAFSYFDPHGSIECWNYYTTARRQEADLTRNAGRVIRIHERDQCEPTLRLLVHKTSRDQAVNSRIRNVTHHEPRIIPACDISDEELFRAMRKAG